MAFLNTVLEVIKPDVGIYLILIESVEDKLNHDNHILVHMVS